MKFVWGKYNGRKMQLNVEVEKVGCIVSRARVAQVFPIIRERLRSPPMAIELFAPPSPPTPFVGRTNELEWLRRAVNSRDRAHGQPIVVVGPVGIGKTSLVAKFLVPGPAVSFSVAITLPNSPPPQPREPIWIPAKELFSDVRDFRSEIRRRTDDRRDPWPIIILDGAEDLRPEQQREAFAYILNFKLVRAVIVTSRNELELGSERVLRLDRLPERDAESLLVDASQSLIGPDSLTKMLSIGDGSPWALKFLAGLAKSRSEEELRQLLADHLYELSKATLATEGKLIAVARTTIVSANEAMISALKKQPQDVYKLTPRQYEELIAELFLDMGFEVELTKATRDGGKDILASLKTEVGQILCLIEAKRYREDRKIGVSLVRTLYGTLCDYKATSAMMVTTSSYSKDAHALQHKHEYRLSLKEYGHVVDWIQRYGTNKK
jgi:restriction system protein